MQLPAKPEIFNWIDVGTPLGSLLYAGVYVDDRGIGLEQLRQWGFYSLALLLDGGGNYYDGEGLEARLQPGDCIWVPPHRNHRYGCEAGGTWAEVYLCFKGAAFDQWRGKGPMGERPVHHLKDLALWAPRWFSIANTRPRNHAEAVATLAQIHLLLNEVASSDRHNWTFEERLDASKYHLQSLPTNALPDWTLLASECQCSYETWRKAFRRKYGVAPARFRRESLMQKAALLMTRSALSNDQLAEQFGCSDAFHFSKLFKSVFGVSPRAYRQSLVQ